MNLSAEYRLLLCCARIKIEEEMVERAKGLLSQDLNWDYLLKCSSSHGITPLMFHNLKMIDKDRIVPHQVLRKLERAYYSNVHHNMKIYGELGKVLKALKDAEIKVMILKGAAIAETAYQNMALRPIGDIDLLVQERDFSKIKNVLVSLGYEPAGSLPGLTSTEAVEYAHYFEQVRFFNEDGLLIETHFRLINMGVPKVEEMVWQKAVTLKVAGGDALIPSVEDSLLYLCIHANQHNYCMIRLFCDIAELVNNYSRKINWGYFLNVVKQRRLESSIYYTLHFTNQLLGVDIPKNILTRLKPGYLRGKLFEFVWGKKTALQLRSMKRPDRTEGPTYYLLEMDRMRDKLTYLHKVMFPPVKWLSYHFSLTPSHALYFKHFASLLEKGLKVFAPAKLNRRT